VHSIMYLFIDTETTGLPARRFAHYTDHDIWPRVVSISWALFHAKDQPLKHVYHIVSPMARQRRLYFGGEV
jgi:DNA polymerase III subunit epsilon